MGRWGMRFFEGDQDIEIALEINKALSGIADLDLCRYLQIDRSNICDPPELTAYQATDDYKRQLEDKAQKCRSTLNSGIGEELFKIFRKREKESNGKYRVLVVGAIMMRAGAVIKDDDFNHLRDLVPEIPCRDGLKPILRNNPGQPSMLAMIMASVDADDQGFRYPGKVQFLAALENYKPGVCRSFDEPRSGSGSS
ncbi:hypothetical protein Daus18300_008265 [Diaporthe australafricana]|uniref:Uncharacterized protein n=1 Tax=Diaporthe australafricana TaxID=127596 RepID=A0ABR3WJ75_9PEZI